jgi:hypothetical protein
VPFSVDVVLRFAKKTSVAITKWSLSRLLEKKVRNSPSFQRSVDHGQYVIELHAWRSPENASFATFIYEKAGERLLRHFTGSDENEVIRQALMWCERD